MVGVKPYIPKTLRKHSFKRLNYHVLGVKMPRVEYGNSKALWIYENIVLNIRRYKRVAAQYRRIKSISATAARGNFRYAGGLLP